MRSTIAAMTMQQMSSSHESKPASRLRLRLFPRGEAAVRSGHPWIFRETIREQNREGQTGDLAIMYDRRDRFLAVGLYDADSPIAVRILHQGEPTTLDRDWWLQQALTAKGRREGPVFRAGTDGGRWIHGECEHFPGLVADRYGDTLVVKLYTLAWLAHWTVIESVLREAFQPRHLVLRLSRNIQGEAIRSWNTHEGFLGEPGEETVVFEELGLKFEAEVLRGQKTGFFLDQRENRARVGNVAAGKDVLNAFSFSGGFSLHAARGGARSVTDLDISAHALESGARNFALNTAKPKVAAARREAVQADVFDWLDEAPADLTYDLIVVDPPSLAKRESQREGALAAYERLTTLALRRLRPGGILVAASCSAHVDSGTFHAVVSGAVRRECGDRWRECWTSEHPADHPASFPEARYLKAVCIERTAP
ncbi:MAG: class I SAM-dependent rRNA methyltransferase [Verrucomicrobiales bacterium]